VTFGFGSSSGFVRSEEEVGSLLKDDLSRNQRRTALRVT